MTLRTTLGVAALLALSGAAAAMAIGYAHLRDDDMPQAQAGMTEATDSAADFPIANTSGKTDRLPVAAPFRLASYSLSDTPAADAPATPVSRYASADPTPSDIRLPDALKPAVADPAPAKMDAAASRQDAAAAKAKVAALPPPKPAKPTNVILNDAQIASLKQRLRLSPMQEPYWPEIEAALRGVVKQIYEANKNGHGKPVPVDTSTAEVERLKTAAMPLLMQMRPDQKAEVINLARIIGMEKLVAML
ncbi:hypothetical protein JQ557_28800 [Bradyrhizobium sp. U87765 SZCCT0131]|uniref:hypothetical protein n=1 Tax=unclassified Bradyrhizobium TaxID=2631580 RepID=UPI001BAAC6DA|nr:MULTISPECIES: hypothetical protein [unclassified Bradyrhizobium]MBR1222032.1 hypothetical protein [Bradyrhizobium sp. U87765 SZCCT0131]MBR1263770.1 hypothetical protein [Bradyrhizobium sp. U87765 SZCCT0134]MBR1302660.1 hypothetical protein [Bradyrhizobium sp. U87765 SZCCT0110]MBR1320020.1 hypothetical protein [Bradyrhizobium sp. U87765 SZCCT0109]MBR1348867.1 hypothetical protein [Bradyrhizobium sp. U87765 SZCCT0048]